MRIHHLNCGTMTPMGGRLVEGSSMPWVRADLVCHCLLLETADRLILVDTGFGLQDVAHPIKRLGLFVQVALQPKPVEAETAVRQIERLGFASGDVSDIAITHLDSDHVGGVEDFPAARVHVHAAEADVARLPGGIKERLRYRGRVDLMSHGPSPWAEHQVTSEQWFGLHRTPNLTESADQAFFVSLPGHTRGHAGVVIDTGRTDGPRWLLHAGDAYMHPDQMNTVNPGCPPLTRAFEHTLAQNNSARRRSVDLLRAVASRDDVAVINAHSRPYVDAATPLPAEPV